MLRGEIGHADHASKQHKNCTGRRTTSTRAAATDPRICIEQVLHHRIRWRHKGSESHDSWQDDAHALLQECLPAHLSDDVQPCAQQAAASENLPEQDGAAHGHSEQVSLSVQSTCCEVNAMRTGQGGVLVAGQREGNADHRVQVAARERSDRVGCHGVGDADGQRRPGTGRRQEHEEHGADELALQRQ